MSKEVSTNMEGLDKHSKLLSKMRIVVLTSFDVAGALILNEIIDSINLVGVFIQRSRPLYAKDFIKRSKIMPGFCGFFMKMWLYFTGQEIGVRFFLYRFCEILYYTIFSKIDLKNKKRKYLLIYKDVLKKHKALKFITSNINSDKCIQLIKETKPDLIITIGGRIIKKNIIDIPPKGVINVHSSVLPKYRGAASEFWAMYNNDMESIGVTVHYVNEGIDNGEIILQERQKDIKNYDVKLISLNNFYLGAELLKKAIDLIEKDQAKTIKQNEKKASLYKFPTRADKKKLKAKIKEFSKKSFSAKN